MTKRIEKSFPEGIRRIMAVVDPAGAYGPALDVATHLVRHLQASGVGLLLRDEALFGASELSVARHVHRVPVSLAVRSRTTAEHEFRTRVRHVERHLSQAATGAWTLVVESGVTRERVVGAMREGDLIVVGQNEGGESAYGRLGEALLARGPRPLLMVPPHAQPVASVQVVYEDTPAGDAALPLAAALARAMEVVSLQVIVVGDLDPKEKQKVEARLSQFGIPVVVLLQPHLDLPAAVRVLQVKRGLLILPATVFEREGPSLPYALRMLGWPFLLVP